MTMSYSEINWEEQWALFAPAFKEGYAHIDLSCFGSPGAPLLRLAPGGGFGDLSHPTTRLMLHLMAERLKNQCVVDIGCGSGILTLAALLLSAKKGIGIDIDIDALSHAEKNKELNPLAKRAVFGLTVSLHEIFSPLTILINMISSEQNVAWASHPVLHSRKARIIASGILVEQREAYLKMTSKWGWDLMEEREEEGWLGFVFEQK